MSRGEGWLRALLWLLPSTYAALAVWFGGRIPSRMFLWSAKTIERTHLWIVSTVLLVAVVGWCWARIKAQSPDGRHWGEIVLWALWFCVMQALLVPVVVGITAMASCVFSF
jgi:hypothetical protein